MNANRSSRLTGPEQRMYAPEQNRNPASERRRIDAVRECGLIDTPPEKEFDELVELAAELCDVPMSWMTLLDDRRLFLKAKVGVDCTEMRVSESICQYTIQQDGCFTVPDATRDERFAALPMIAGEGGIRFYAGVPLRTATGLVVGTLCVSDTRPREITRRQETVLSTLATQMSARLHLRAQSREMQSMAEQMVAERELFRCFLDSMPTEVYLKDGAGRIMFYNRKLAERFGISQTAWVGMTSYDLWTEEKADLIRAEEEYALRLNRAYETYVELPGQAGETTYWKTIMTPVQRGDGEVWLVNVAVDLSPELKRQATLQHTQDALEEANRKLRSLSLTDNLTGLWNRRAFDVRIEMEVDRAQDTRQPLTMLMIDVDDLRRLNDEHGHTHGDEVLRQVAGILRHAARVDDVVARYGGEEFAILLPGTDLAGAGVLCKRIHAAFARAPWLHRAVTVSIGIGTWREGRSAADLTGIAEGAMFRAKSEGKNRVVVSEPEDEAAGPWYQRLVEPLRPAAPSFAFAARGLGAV